ncbi:MAG: hypothetical protein ACI4V3_01735 [Faecousia sp.]
MVASLCVITACAAGWYAFDLQTTGCQTDLGNPRYKSTSGDASIGPEVGTNMSQGVTFYMNQSNAYSNVGTRATGDVERFNLNPFTISYRPGFGSGEYYRLGVYSYTKSAGYPVGVRGNWPP